jgi:sulfatase modifying factor 1
VPLRRRTATAVAVLLFAGAAHGEEEALRLDLGGGVTLDLVRVPEGTFEQGSPADEVGRAEDETSREVTLGKAFYLGAHEVTRLQFTRFVIDTAYVTEAEKGGSGGFGWDGHALVQKKEYNWKNPGFPQTDAHPVVLVTYDDALAFAAWASRKTGRTITLPTEAQWEYAARAGGATRFPGVGSDRDLASAAWYKANSEGATHPVGGKKPNALGLFDMAGNAYEWCRDWYGPAYAAGPATDPEETRSTLGDKPRRVLRGGSWLKDAKGCRVAARYRNAPGSRNADNGFRVASSLDAPRAAAVVPTAAPPSPATVTPPTSDSSSAGSLSGLLLLATGCGLIPLAAILVVRLLWQRRGRSGGAGYRDVSARYGPEGFWLKAPKIAEGSTIRYRVIVDGVERDGEVTAMRDVNREQYVYTGGTPTLVEVLAVNAAAELFRPGPSATGRRERERESVVDTGDDDDDDPAPFRGYPSAY